MGSIGIDDPLPPVALNSRPAKEGSQEDYFLKGPIPCDWFRVAADTNSTQAMRVGLALWQVSGVMKNMRVPLNWKCRQIFGIKRNTASRGLKKLAEAGLIRIIEQRKGSHPYVEIVVAGGYDNKKPTDNNQ